MFLSRGDRDHGDAFQTHPVSQASARGEAKDSDILLGHDRYLLEPTECRSQGWEDPLEKEMATHSSILAWRIPWTEEPGGLQSMGSQRVGYDPGVRRFLFHHVP